MTGFFATKDHIELKEKLFSVFFVILRGYTNFETVLAFIRGEKLACRSHPRTWPVPVTSHLWLQSSFRPIGPRAWRRSVLMPISAPRPNSKPS